ncbi:hypothetical protein Pelo_14537 [Pelomyxa schiedti]|nr:hypothetical protein Pelo_14537 [Pelomyxa schiedti]
MAARFDEQVTQLCTKCFPSSVSFVSVSGRHVTLRIRATLSQPLGTPPCPTGGPQPHGAQWEFVIRPLQEGDQSQLSRLAAQLSDATRVLFMPYKWTDPAHSYDVAVCNCTSGRDAMFLMFARPVSDSGSSSPAVESVQNPGETDGIPIAHFGVQKIAPEAPLDPDNPANREVVVPDFLLCVVDAWHGHGIGSFAVDFVSHVCRHILGCHGIELTTALFNDHAAHIYSKQGFEDVGTMRIPLGVDVTNPAELARAVCFRVERHMVKILDPSSREIVLKLINQRATEKP